MCVMGKAAFRQRADFRPDANRVFANQRIAMFQIPAVVEMTHAFYRSCLIAVCYLARGPFVLLLGRPSPKGIAIPFEPTRVRAAKPFSMRGLAAAINGAYF